MILHTLECLTWIIFTVNYSMKYESTYYIIHYIHISYELWSGSEKNDEMINRNKLRITPYVRHFTCLTHKIFFSFFFKQENWNHDIFHFLCFHLNQCQRRVLLNRISLENNMYQMMTCIYHTLVMKYCFLQWLDEWLWKIAFCLLNLERWVNSHFVYLWR